MDEGVGRGVMHKMMRKRRKSRRRRMRPSWDPLGAILETSWGPLGPLQKLLGPSRALLKAPGRAQEGPETEGPRVAPEEGPAHQQLY